MENVFDLVQAYREEVHLEPRKELAGKLATILARELRVFVIGRIPPSFVDDVMQETMKAIFINLFKFLGKTEKEFWGWCKQIARNKTTDRLRSEKPDRLKYFPSEELLQLAESSDTGASSLSPEDRVDLKYALDLLAKSALDCRHLLWDHYVIGMEYAEIAEIWELKYDAVRMRIKRCLETARSLLN